MYEFIPKDHVEILIAFGKTLCPRIFSGIENLLPNKYINNGMLDFQTFKLPYHLIAIRLKIANYKKFDVVLQLNGGQNPSESLHRLFKIIISQADQDWTDLCQHIPRSIYCIWITVLKFDMLQ